MNGKSVAEKPLEMGLWSEVSLGSQGFSHHWHHWLENGKLPAHDCNSEQCVGSSPRREEAGPKRTEKL